MIAATQVDLDEAMKDGRFRSDLFWRLNVIHVAIPPVRERREDILYLSSRFVSQHAAEMNKQVGGLSRDAEAYLMDLAFPGNIRELRNMLERAVALCDGPRIEKHDLLPLDGDDMDAEDTPHTLKAAIADAECRAIHSSLERHNWAIGKTAEDLEISRKSLWEKMRRYKIEQ